MALRLVEIITQDLLSLKEAFEGVDAIVLSGMLVTPVLETIERDCGGYWALILKPILPMILNRIVKALKEEIDEVLDLSNIVLDSFVRDKEVLVDLFQDVGRVELKFLVQSGFGFGFLLGIAQMALWAIKPKPWTLPVAGAMVGYATNWVAIKLLFEPAEAQQIGPFVLQGLFEGRQVEVSDEFAHFMKSRVLTSTQLLSALANQNEKDLFNLLRREMPYPIPEHLLRAAVKAIKTIAAHPEEHEELHNYVTQQLDIEKTLSSRLKLLNPKQFENLLHPVFQEDEIILIAIGGILGALAGLMQTRLGWGGPRAKALSVATIAFSLSFSAVLFNILNIEKKSLNQKDKIEYKGVTTRIVPNIQRKNTILRKEFAK